jgi:hypothetical protein
MCVCVRVHVYMYIYTYTTSVAQIRSVSPLMYTVLVVQEKSFPRAIWPQDSDRTRQGLQGARVVDVWP